MLNLAAFIWLKIHFSYKEGSDKSGKGQGERAKLHKKKKKKLRLQYWISLQAQNKFEKLLQWINQKNIRPLFFHRILAESKVEDGNKRLFQIGPKREAAAS